MTYKAPYRNVGEVLKDYRRRFPDYVPHPDDVALFRELVELERATERLTQMVAPFERIKYVEFFDPAERGAET
jgi:hypothetical protein